MIGLLLVLSLCRRSARCPQPFYFPNSEQFMGLSLECPLSYIGGLHQLSSPIYPTSCPWLGIHLAVGSRGPPPPGGWLRLAAHPPSGAVCNTAPSRASARQLRRFTRVWRLEPAPERLRRWMRTRVARSPYQVGCSCHTIKAISLSRTPYTPQLYSKLGIGHTEQSLCGTDSQITEHLPVILPPSMSQPERESGQTTFP